MASDGDTQDDAAADVPFRIEGPDADGFVWICSSAGRHVWCNNLGPFEPAANAMADWLAAKDFGE